MRWTTENDHILLVLLLDTHNINLKGERIRDAWPQDGRDVPTARAITERIVKIRALSKASLDSSPIANFDYSNTPPADLNAPTSTTTTTTTTTTKRKRGPKTKGKYLQNDDVDDEEVKTAVIMPKQGRGRPRKKPKEVEEVEKVVKKRKTVKKEEEYDNEEEEGEEGESLMEAKRRKTNMVKVLTGFGPEADNADSYSGY